MTDLKSFVTGLVQQPGLVKGLLENPQEAARMAGLGEGALHTLTKSLTQSASVLSGLMNGPGKKNAPAPVARVEYVNRVAGKKTTGDGVPLAGVVSLLAVAGADAAVGTVTLVALAGQKGHEMYRPSGRNGA